MDMGAGLNLLWSGGLVYVIPFLFVLTMIVFFHELGHYLVGRWCGIRVLSFSVGFGPELAGFTDRRGTRWKISAIPLGGYVKFFGDENAASVPDRDGVAALSEDERREAFPTASVGRRAATVAAGPLANFILALVIFAAVAYVAGRPVSDPIVSEVVEGSPAEAAGFAAGDRILSVDGREISYFSELQQYVSSRGETPIDVVVDRGGRVVDVTVTPRIEEREDGFGGTFNVPVVGIVARSDETTFRVEDLSLPQAVAYGAEQTWFVTARTVEFLGQIVTGRQNANQIGGPIRIAQVSGEVSALGLGPLLNLAALLSISIGLLNLFPIPMLDGGHLLFYALEAVRGKPLSEEAQEIGFRVGFALVMMLMAFAFWNDLTGMYRA